MRLAKVKDIFSDWYKGGYLFGFNFSASIAGRLEASPTTSRVGGAIFDLAAGGGLAYLAVTGIIASVLVSAAAIAAVATAPVSALVVPCVNVIWIALNCMMGGIALGLLNAGRLKCNISNPSFYARKAQSAVAEKTGSFKLGAQKLSARFKHSVRRQPKPDTQKAPQVKTPESGRSFDL